MYKIEKVWKQGMIQVMPVTETNNSLTTDKMYNCNPYTVCSEYKPLIPQLISSLYKWYSGEMKFTRYFTAADQSATLFSPFAVEKVEYFIDWSERTNQLTITLFSTVHRGKK